MEIAQKVKLALDETRMLILGAQILLGFQLRGVFSDGYEQLPTHARHLDAVALGLMVCVVGLLIVPGPYHRVVMEGEDDTHFHRLVTAVANLALFPFAVALGLDVIITAGRILGSGAGVAIGIVATAVAIGFWYGFPWLRKRSAGRQERAMISRNSEQSLDTPLHTKIEQMLTEARVVLPGAQALFGFQLAIVLTQSFEQLPQTSRMIHATAIFLVALAVVLLMAPAAYHRIVYAGEDTPDMYRVGSALVTMATLPLALGLAADIYVVIAKIAGSLTTARIAAIVCLAGLVGLWHVYPVTSAYLRNRGD
jgi:Family of unknown function (DUF6328)